MQRQYSDVPNTYTCNVNIRGKETDVQKVMTKLGIHVLDEVVLDILPAPHETSMNINDVKGRLELPIKTNANYNWSGFLVEGILNKLQSEFLAEPELAITREGKERRIGWRLSQDEYERRLDNEEECIDE